VNEILSASAWVTRWISQFAAGGIILDVACGSGRHTQLLLDHGFRVVAVDVIISALTPLRHRRHLELVQADLENEPWPFASAYFDGIVVTNYLHRPIFPDLLASLKPGGVFIYETFARGNGEIGRPSNPDFLLQPGELLRVVDGKARVIAYEDVYTETPKPALVQRICAVADGGSRRQFPALAN
jgi:SAM-dependent methyltransferase